MLFPHLKEAGSYLGILKRARDTSLISEKLYREYLELI